MFFVIVMVLSLFSDSSVKIINTRRLIFKESNRVDAIVSNFIKLGANIDVNENDKFITLSTCSYEIKQTQMGRLTVIGRLVRPGESSDGDFSLVKENPNPRYPQIWYDEHGIPNPYKDAFRWVPK